MRCFIWEGGGGRKGERKGWRGREGDGGEEKEMEGERKGWRGEKEMEGERKWRGRMVGRRGNGLLNCSLVTRESGNVPGVAPTTSG